MILAGLGSELEAEVELSGCSSESESELGQEKAQPTTKELCTKSGLDEEAISMSRTKKAQTCRTRRGQTSLAS